MTRALKDFTGKWLLERVITPKDGNVARFSGQASWMPDADGLRYCETGQLQMPGQTPIHAERVYLWHADLSVYFEDGRLFHTVPPSGGAAAHWCPPDQYDGFYDFGDWPKFRVSWQVRGPQKNYTLVSNYTRS